MVMSVRAVCTPFSLQGVHTTCRHDAAGHTEQAHVCGMQGGMRSRRHCVLKLQDSTHLHHPCSTPRLPCSGPVMLQHTSRVHGAVQGRTDGLQMGSMRACAHHPPSPSLSFLLSGTVRVGNGEKLIHSQNHVYSSEEVQAEGARLQGF